MMWLKSLILATSLGFSVYAHSDTLLSSRLYPGGVVVLPIHAAKKPLVTFNKKPVLVIPNNHSETQKAQWLAIIGLPLNTKLGTHHAVIQANHHKKRAAFIVGAKKYPEEHLTVAPAMVNPAPLDLQRINRETQIMQKAFAAWDERSFDKLDIYQPIQGRFSSPFGFRRIFNDEPRNPHSGLDIAAPLGTPVGAAMDGRVIATGHFYFSGNTIIIEHGQGLKTMYCHLNEILVHENDEVKKQQIIGKVGKTGRVTGPHLHWTIVLNEAKIDPKIFIN